MTGACGLYNLGGSATEASVRSLLVTFFVFVSSSNPASQAWQEGEGVSTFLFLSKPLQMCQPPYARVLAYFHKHFKGYVSSPLDPNAHACKTSSSGTYETKQTKDSPLYSMTINPKHDHTFYGVLIIKTKTLAIPLP
jgi:hypothetical protein